MAVWAPRQLDPRDRPAARPRPHRPAPPLPRAPAAPEQARAPNARRAPLPAAASLPAHRLPAGRACCTSTSESGGKAIPVATGHAREGYLIPPGRARAVGPAHRTRFLPCRRAREEGRGQGGAVGRDPAAALRPTATRSSASLTRLREGSTPPGRTRR